jgi:hypothetical protein
VISHHAIALVYGAEKGKGMPAGHVDALLLPGLLAQCWLVVAAMQVACVASSVDVRPHHFSMHPGFDPRGNH